MRPRSPRQPRDVEPHLEGDPINGPDARSGGEKCAQIPIEANTIWKPDVELLNQAEMPEQTEAPRAYLYDQQKAATAGYNIMLSIPTIFESKCELDMYLPRARQRRGARVESNVSVDTKV